MLSITFYFFLNRVQCKLNDEFIKSIDRARTINSRRYRRVMEDNEILERNTSAADDLPLFNRLFYILLPKNLDIKSNQ